MTQSQKLPIRLHHNAYVTRDQEKTRRFYEEVIGMPLVATWCESDELFGKMRTYCHTFYGMADGGALAFFQFADPEMYELTQAKQPAKIGRYDHIAFKAEAETYDELKRRLERAGEKYRETNHGYCKSIYVNSPDGLIVEFTQDPEDAPRSTRSAAPTPIRNWRVGSAATAAPTTSCAAAPSRFRRKPTEPVEYCGGNDQPRLAAQLALGSFLGAGARSRR